MSGDKPDAQRETETVGPPKLASHVEWQRVDGDGEEEFDLYEFGVGAQWILHGSLDMPAADAAERWVRYMITCDANWRTRRVVLARAKTLFELRRFPEINPFFILSADGKGNWRAGVWGVGERERPDLRGCLDVDLGCSPSTNTLPIRRLNLDVGASAEVTAAWVRFPDLAVETLRQRYTRLAPDRYRYESLESVFTADLTVDDQGLVVDYPGGWRRATEET